MAIFGAVDVGTSVLCKIAVSGLFTGAKGSELEDSDCSSKRVPLKLCRTNVTLVERTMFVRRVAWFVVMLWGGVGGGRNIPTQV